jgi:hypothetical protein
MHLDVEWVHERYNKPLKKRPIRVVRTKKENSSKKTKLSWYHAIDTEYVHILVKFERKLSISVLRNKAFCTK